MIFNNLSQGERNYRRQPASLAKKGTSVNRRHWPKKAPASTGVIDIFFLLTPVTPVGLKKGVPFVQFQKIGDAGDAGGFGTGRVLRPMSEYW